MKAKRSGAEPSQEGPVLWGLAPSKAWGRDVLGGGGGGSWGRVTGREAGRGPCKAPLTVGRALLCTRSTGEPRQVASPTLSVLPRDGEGRLKDARRSKCRGLSTRFFGPRAVPRPVAAVEESGREGFF